MSANLNELRAEVAALRRKAIPNCDGLEEEYSNIQTRADPAYRATGHDGAPGRLLGESVTDYRLRLLNGVKAKSPTWRGATLPRAADVLNAAEPQILSDAVASLRDNANYAPGELKEVIERDATGRRITKFYGDNSITWAPFQPSSVKYVTGFGGGK